MSAPTTVTRIRFAGLELDLLTGELWKGDGRTVLAEQPFRLLAILIRARGSLVTRDELRRALAARREAVMATRADRREPEAILGARR